MSSNKTKLLSFLFLIGMISSCTEPVIDQGFVVEHHGALKEMMHKGDLSSKASLADFAGDPHLYALGALENLKGEILVLDGKPWISVGDGVTFGIDTTFNHKAALLVRASVSEWQSFDIPDGVITHDELETFVGQMAQEAGLAENLPFPFLIEGKYARVDWHVIDWPEGDTEHSHEKHVKSGPHGSITDVEADILGFYSSRHHAIFTHHTTNMHMHVKTRANNLAAHVDDVELGPGMKLKLPVSTANQ